MPESGNIQRLKELLERLDGLERELYPFFVVSLDLCCIAGVETKTFTRVNPMWEKELGWTEAELVSKPYAEFVHPEDVEATDAASSRLVNGQNVISFVNRYMIKGGGWATLEWSSTVDDKTGLVFATARILKKEYRE